MNLVYCALEPILSLRLEDYENLSDNLTGFIYSIEPGLYMVSTFLIPYIVPTWVAHRVTMITSLFILCIASLLVGPFFESENLVSMIIGLGISGFMMGFLCIPTMPEMIDACKLAHPKADQDHANSILSGIFNAAYGLGLSLGPLTGATLYELVGFRNTLNIIAGLVFI